jgi:RNA polymerase sigma-70 factor (ECF subfamily)
MRVERHELGELVDRLIRDELTPRQRQALLGRMVEEKPLVVLAAELDTNKDNVYKLIHDARRRLKRALQERGLTGADVLAAFAR